MSNVARVPITNVYMDGDYTGRILVGPHKQPVNVILDTGSSSLALDGHKYKPDVAGGDRTTDLAQADAYGDDSSWVGAVIETTVAVGDGASEVVFAGANVAVAYDATSDMFAASDGILGLAYAALDDAHKMPKNTWTTRYTGSQVYRGQQQTLAPYLTQLAGADVVSDKVSFYTRRSMIHLGGGSIADDPLNQGWMIVGGGEESNDLYTGPFQAVKVLADEWYSTNVKAIIVGTAEPVVVRARGSKGAPSNSIVDSGTNSIVLPAQLLKAVLSKFSADQQALLRASIVENRMVAATDLNLAKWPNITFVLQGSAVDAKLTVSPNDYWQINAGKVGAAQAGFVTGAASDGIILGLPLMNGYFTIFDGEADGGKGEIRFATSKR